MSDLIDYDYKIITIDSDSNVATYRDSSNCDFFLTLDDPFRNVFKINIITMLLNIPNNSYLKTNLNSIYVNLNNYNRIISKNINAFDSIIIENPITDSTPTNNTTIKNEYYASDSIFYLNPIEPQLKRFSIRLIDNNNITIPKSYINRFVMKIGVYYNNKKTTRI
jgi:hypothetical protein